MCSGDPVVKEYEPFPQMFTTIELLGNQNGIHIASPIPKIEATNLQNTYYSQANLQWNVLTA